MNICFIRLNQEHLPLMFRWLEMTHVKEWWDSEIIYNNELLHEKYGPRCHDRPIARNNERDIYAFIILIDQTPIGYIQTHQEKATQPFSAGCDFFIGESDYLGKGLGSKIIKQFCDEILFKSFSACVVDPVRNNKRAIATYRKAGFTEISETENICCMLKMKDIIIETERLMLRTWHIDDAQKYYEINQDKKVIEFLAGPMMMEEVQTFIVGANEHQVQYGYSLWATVEKESNQLMGFIGLNKPKWQTHFAPAPEIAWRLGSQYWGKGYASEGAKAALQYGFNQCDLNEIVSFTVPMNKRSIHVMKRIGMKRDESGDFHHTKLPSDHPLSWHILYRIAR